MKTLIAALFWQQRPAMRWPWTHGLCAFANTCVTGVAADPLWRCLAEVSGDAPRWNAHKSLLDRQGRVGAGFPGEVAPDDPWLIATIETPL